ncbi:MAG: ribonuclease HII [Chlamydiales bacterium]|nr:ribonuclease HII [Chlamydiales bacterium]
MHTKKRFKNPSNQLPKSEQERLTALVQLEREALLQGYCRLAGVDEAGRGPLAGPVVAAACLFRKPLFFPGINDSKLLTPKKRRELFEQLTSHCEVAYSIATISPMEIDRINILQATLKAMHEAVSNLPEKPDYLMVDGMQLKTEIPAQKIIKGDRLSQLIAAASVIAKESRDRLMEEYDRKYPAYGFAKHKGYGTYAHRVALTKYGPSPIHRKTFKWEKVDGVVKFSPL